MTSAEVFISLCTYYFLVSVDSGIALLYDFILVEEVNVYQILLNTKH